MFRPRAESEIFFKRIKRKIFIFSLLVSAGSALIALRLWHLQVVQYSAMSSRAENNRIREITLDGLRGRILDRDGALLVDSRPSFQLSIIPEDVEEPKRVLGYLSREIDLDMDESLGKIKAAKPFNAVTIKGDISREQVAFVEESRIDTPGVFMRIKPIRNYIYGEFGAHFLGYLGAITASQLSAAPPSVYSRDDFIGQYGIEKNFEEILRGSKGLKRVEVDAAGRELTQLGAVSPKSGTNLRVTLDLETQKAAEAAFRGHIGAAIAIDPRNGDVLAYVSEPSFDPNTFAYGISAAKWKALLEDEFHPLQDRVSQGQYPPGSTFKIVVAAAALEEGIINPDSKIFCPGHFRLGARTYRCWKKEGHGPVNAHEALVQSCDVFFYTLGLKLGMDKIAQYAKLFGLGQKTGIGLGAEREGLIPTIEWKERTRKEPWIMGETVSCSIGQGYVLATPAQQARMIAFVANGGKLVTPRITIGDGPSYRSQDDAAATRRGDARISPFTIGLIREALLGVVYEPHGTAWRIKNGPYTYAGKTGTSQVVRMKQNDDREIDEIDFRHRDHGWFVAFAPYDDPKIAVAVIAEHAGHGGEAAAPIAQAIMDTYLNGLKRKTPTAPPVAENRDKRAYDG